MKDTVIKISELPVRSDKLVLNDIKNVFGGCGTQNDKCTKDSDCCSGYHCNIYECWVDTPPRG